MQCTIYEMKLKKMNSTKKLFSYISGGIKSPKFLITNNLLKKK